MTSYPVPYSGAAAEFSAGRVLIASPNSSTRKRVLETLARPVQHCEQASGGAEALVRLERGTWQVLFLDRRLPDLDAAEVSQTVRQRYPGVEVVMLDEEQETTCAEAGSGPARSEMPGTQEQFALLQNRDDTMRVLSTLVAPSANSSVLYPDPLGAAGSGGMRSSACQHVADADQEDALPLSLSPQALPLPEPLPGMIGNSPVMHPVYRLVRLLSQRNTTVLITGPTGSGKEVVARAVHQLSPRSQRGFAVVNCAAIPETLLEAELFGYARGAFTGAMQAYAGRIQAAHGGTLFLDEIGEMPLSLQPKLLRFLEQKEVQRLGSSEVVRVDARIVSATNAHLLSLVKEGKFREDLYYRLCGFPVELPALRERGDDIALLARHFLQKFSQAAAPRSSVPQLSSAARQLLETQPWPGNIRELQNVMERALILAENRSVIRPEHLLLNLAPYRNVN